MIPLMTDDGCEHSPSCLTCPLPACKYDVGTPHPLVLKANIKANRAKALLAQGSTTEQVAEQMGVHVRTVQRYKRGGV